EEGESAIQPYWVMTSGNDIIDDMIERNPQHRERLARLMNGETLSVPIYKNISYRDLQSNPESIWSFLLYTGYLKAIGLYKNEDNIPEAEIAIPNTEIKTVMFTAMRHWWQDVFIGSYPATTLGEALRKEDIAQIEEILNDVLMDSVSVFDYHENFYHGMLLGLLLRTPFHRVFSNREYGEGRPDIVAFGTPTALLFELKCVTQRQIDEGMKADLKADEEDIIEAKMIAALDEAEHQIDRRRYVNGVKVAFPNAKEIKIYTLCFCRKRCMARLVE
ncbi:MAG: PD-(D/E)XK nuclease domain-containing protein, partial [Proteobacteria bacterium]|nr:PD-(D/E)XK nuclease domain-containing protein [Pseudomonadota bacterium]